MKPAQLAADHSNIAINGALQRQRKDVFRRKTGISPRLVKQAVKQTGLFALNRRYITLVNGATQRLIFPNAL